MRHIEILVWLWGGVEAWRQRRPGNAFYLANDLYRNVNPDRSQGLSGFAVLCNIESRIGCVVYLAHRKGCSTPLNPDRQRLLSGFAPPQEPQNRMGISFYLVLRFSGSPEPDSKRCLSGFRGVYVHPPRTG